MLPISLCSTLTDLALSFVSLNYLFLLIKMVSPPVPDYAKLVAIS
jgi:hypothetical protein